MSPDRPSIARNPTGRRSAVIASVALSVLLASVASIGTSARPVAHSGSSPYQATLPGRLLLPLALRGRIPAALPTAAPTEPATPSLPTQAPRPSPSAGPTPTLRPPVTTHPRLWLTAEDLPRLRRWATAANPMYQRGLAAAARAGRARADAHWSWSAEGGTGSPDSGWQDGGSREYERDYTEAYAQMFAFLSLVEPDPAVRDEYGQRARDMLLWMLRQAALGPAAGEPFRDPVFATFNRANALGMAIPLTVDWIYGYLSPADKATIRRVFLRWIRDNETAYPISSGPLTNGSLVNDLRLLGSSPAQAQAEQAAAQKQLRWTANNYWLGHMRYVTLMALSLDPADDPDGALTGYVDSVTGHWLYAAYAMFEDAQIVNQALGVPPGNRSIGLASGGLPVEGTLYGSSLGFLSQTLLALHTAGLDDPRIAGPQAELVHSAYWDRAIAGFLHSISPTSRVPDSTSGLAYLGPVHVPATYGDLLRNWVTWEGILTFGPLAVLDTRLDNAERLATLRWILRDALQGGPDRLYDRAANIWGNGDASDSILYFLAFDPASAPAPDPRPALPLSFVDRSYGRLLSRTDWGPDARWLTFKCSWMTINHQNGDCNQFELWRKGEWLTKERSGYAHDAILMTSDHHNTLALQNNTPANPIWFESETIARGGQWTNGTAAGDPATRFSSGPGYVFAEGDGTNLYNRPPDALDIRHASRSLVWLQPDTVVIYDRATSASPNRFKRFHLTLLRQPTVQDRRAVMTTPGGQQLVVRSLLPVDAVLTASPAEGYRTVAELEPSQGHLLVEDPRNPADLRFLHVLQALDAGAAAAPASLLESDVGERLAGAQVGDTVVLFRVEAGASLREVRYSVPSITRVHIVTGLEPGRSYGLRIEAVGGKSQVTLTAGGATVTTDAAGVARF